jgi:hypothetical protein
MSATGTDISQSTTRGPLRMADLTCGPAAEVDAIIESCERQRRYQPLARPSLLLGPPRQQLPCAALCAKASNRCKSRSISAVAPVCMA